MTPDDVTSEMERVYFGEVYSKRERTLKEEIAAAFNAVFSDAEPITAEWLDTNYPKSELGPLWDIDLKGWIKLRVFGVDGQFSAMIIQKKTVIQVPTKTIGQLRALHAGLRIGDVS